MHRTLKAEATRPAGQSQLQQQEHFDDFKQSYNCERPHEALEMKTPHSFYVPSKRTLEEAQKALTYPLHDLARAVNDQGMLKLEGRRCFIGRAVRGQTVGIRDLGNHLHLISLGPFELGYANMKTEHFTLDNPLDCQEE